MKSKWSLFAGIILLIAGIIIRRTTGFAMEGLVMIIVGVLLKTYYIISKARSGEYKPGKELLFLFVGLGLFLAGLYLRSSTGFVYAPAMIITGIALKVIFIILFIIKTRKKEIQ
jgi:hypothetical protein